MGPMGYSSLKNPWQMQLAPPIVAKLTPESPAYISSTSSPKLVFLAQKNDNIYNWKIFLVQ